MSSLAKKQFVEDLVKHLAERQDALTINGIRDAVTKCLDSYDLTAITGDAPTFDLLSAYIQAKSVEGKTKGTLVRYEYIIKRFLKYVKVPEASVTIHHIRDYFSAQKERGISDRTLNGERSVYSAYFAWLTKERLISYNPCDNLNPISHTKKVRKPFSDTDIEKMKESCTTARNKAIITFLLSTGCRVNEVCSLNRSAVSLDTKECTVLGKGNKERIVYLNDVAAMLLSRYFESRTDNDDCLFLGRNGKRIKPGGIRAMLKTLEKKSGVENVHPHRFRRTLATNLIKRGMPIQEVARILGHEKIDTTMQYVYIENSSVKSSYRKYAA